MHITLEQFRQEQAIESQDALLKVPRIEISRIVQQQMLPVARNCTGWLGRAMVERWAKAAENQ